jgi:hypothetical protein
MIDIQSYHQKLQRDEIFSKEESILLLNELAHFRTAAADLASWHAVLAECLHESASETARARLALICNSAAGALGESHPAPFSQQPGNAIDNAIERCKRAVNDLSPPSLP